MFSFWDFSIVFFCWRVQQFDQLATPEFQSVLVVTRCPFSCLTVVFLAFFPVLTKGRDCVCIIKYVYLYLHQRSPRFPFFASISIQSTPSTPFGLRKCPRWISRKTVRPSDTWTIYMVLIVAVRERYNFFADFCNSLCSCAIEWTGTVLPLLMAGNSFLDNFMAVGDWQFQLFVVSDPGRFATASTPFLGHFTSVLVEPLKSSNVWGDMCAWMQTHTLI